MQVRLIVPNEFVEPGTDSQTGEPCILKTKFRPIVAYGPTIADIAGGFTASQATGGWKDNHGNLIVEPVTVFDCYITPPVGHAFRYAEFLATQAFVKLAKRIAQELSQDCVYLSFDGKVEFVTK